MSPSPFTHWLSEPRPGRGIHLAEDRTGWRRFEYPDLAGAARRMGTRLAKAGVRPGDTVCLTVPTEYHSVVALFGSWVAGATVCPLPPPSFQPDREYIDHLAAIVRQAQPTVTVTCPEYLPLVADAMARAGLPEAVLAISDDAISDDAVSVEGVPGEERGAPAGWAPMVPMPPGQLALLQFTSGSTSSPQGVRVSWENLMANLAVQRRWSGWRDGDGVASWLPLYHDMGLIGCLLFAVAGQSDLWLMRPAQFIRDPGRWLECFQPGQAHHSAAPSSAFRYAVRRMKPEQLHGLDLSQWRSVMVGAEVVDRAALETFVRFAAPTGLSPATLVPAYGLAENTLGVSSPGRGHPIPVVRPDWTSLRIGAPVTVIDQEWLDAELDGPAGVGAGWLVGHGGPEPEDGIKLHIVDDNGIQVPDGHLGEIVVHGTSVALGYHGAEQDRVTRFAGGVLHTGDAGFIHDGQLYVVGRMGDSLKLHGRGVYVEDLDGKVAEAAQLSRDRIAVVASTVGGRAGVAVFAENRPGPWTGAVTERLRAELGPEPVITIVAGTRGLIRRTSSGKPQRRHMWRLLHDKALSGVTVIDGATDAAADDNPKDTRS